MAATFDAVLRVNAKTTGEGAIKQMGNALGGLSERAKGITTLATALGGLGVAVSAAGLGMAAKGAIDAADNFDKLSNKTGASVEALSKLGAAADLSGSSIDAIGKGLIKLGKNMGEVAAGGGRQAADAFTALGISITDSSGKLRNADDVFLDIADRFEKMPDGVEKANMALALFGKSGAELIPTLTMGKKAIQDLETGMSTAFAKNAVIYNDNLTHLQRKISSIGVTILETIMPTLIKVTETAIVLVGKLQEWFTANKERIGEFAAQLVNVGKKMLGLATPIAAGIAAFRLFTTTIQIAQAALKGFILLQSMTPVGILAATAGLSVGMLLVGKAAAAISDMKKDLPDLSNAVGSQKQNWEGILDAIQETTEKQGVSKELSKQSATAEKIYSDQIAITNQRYDIGIQAINRRAAALQQTNSIAAEQNNLQVAQNNLGQVILQNKLALAKTDQEKLAITKEIAALEQEAARLQYQATMQQIQAERALLQIKKESANKEWEKASAAAQTAKNLLEQGRISQDVANKAIANARQAQSAAAAANNELRSFNQKANIQAQTANVNMRIAEVRAQGQVQQAQASAQQAQTVTQPMGQPRYYIETPNGRIPQYAKGGFVARPTLAVVGEGGEPEYVVPQSKAMSFANNIVAGRRGEAAIKTARTWTDQMNVGHLAPRGGFTNNLQVLAALRQQGVRATIAPGSGTVTSRREGVRSSGRSGMSLAATPIAINIQTGPVMEMNGQKYVSYDDLERAMRVTADGVIGRLRTPYARQALGR